MKYKIADFTIVCEPDLLQPARDLLADAVAEIGFEAFEETANGLKGYIQEQMLDVEALKQTLNDFPLSNVEIGFTIADAENKNWNEAWEAAGFDPIDIDGKIVVYDARTESDAHEPSPVQSIRIGIEARQAFGTGTHQTTRLMIEMLLQIPLAGRRVLDCGCGTGILSIVACKLGAAEAVGYDIDEWSVENAKHNAQLNHVEQIDILSGDSHVLSHVSGVFDVILANINRNSLLADMTVFKEMMNTQATLVLSGFYESDASLIVDEAGRLGLRETLRKTEDDWCCIAFVN